MSDIYLSLTETPTVVTLSQPVVSGVLSSNVTVTNVVSVNVVTMPAINVTAAAPSVTTVAGSVAVSNFPSVTTVAGTVALDANSLSALENVTVTVGAAVSVSNFPSTQTIAGTVTANLNSDSFVAAIIENNANGEQIAVEMGNTNGAINSSNPLDVSGTVTANLDSNNFNGALTSYVEAVSSHNAFPVEIAYQPSVTIGSLPAISGTVTVSNATAASAVFVKICGEREGAGLSEPREILTDDAGMLYVRLAPNNARTADPVIYDPVGGTAYINVRQQSGTSITVGNSVTIGSLPAISGTVTAAAPNGSLTTRFGTPTTANTAFATSAVTNANRKYLLIQNVTTGSNVITVGIGFTPTTTQGIQLTAGAGITFESSYIPTGQIFVLSSVTASNFTILEA